MTNPKIQEALVKLGTANPELRDTIRPLLTKTAVEVRGTFGYWVTQWLVSVGEEMGSRLNGSFTLQHTENDGTLQGLLFVDNLGELLLDISMSAKGVLQIGASNPEEDNAEPFIVFKRTIPNFYDLLPREVAAYSAAQLKKRWNV